MDNSSINNKFIGYFKLRVTYIAVLLVMQYYFTQPMEIIPK